MRRSYAPSQLAKKPRFTPPVKNEVTAASHAIKEESSSEVSSARATEDILALFSLDSQLKAGQNTEKSDDNITSHISSSKLEAEEHLVFNDRASKFSPKPNFKNAPTNSDGKCLTKITSQHFLKPLQERNSSTESANFHDQPNVTSDEKYFSVVWCKRSTRKHKKWEGDAVLVVKTRSVVLKDMEGKVIGQSSGYKMGDLATLEDGNTLPIGGKEVEIQGTIPCSEYTSGRCFLGGSTSVLADAVPPSSRPKPKPFRLPTRQNSNSSLNPAKKPCSGQALYSCNYPHSLVFPRPTARQQLGESSGSVTDVVLDPRLSSHLRPHQREGVVFLYRSVMGHAAVAGKSLENGCILADEMGLGKTLQCIALVWTLLKQNPWAGGGGVVKRVLVVAPSSLVANWGKEFNKWLGKERLQVYLVDNNKKVEDFFRQQSSPVLVVSYDQLLRCQEELCRPGHGFGLVICDEGHRLKNATSKTSVALAALPIARRVLLTGTPVQNDLQELFALSNFVVPGALGSSTAFRRVYEGPIVAAQQTSASDAEKDLGNERVKELNKITSQFILRRTQAIINKYLPPKVECVVFCQPSASQEAVYSSVAGLVASTALTAGAGVDHLSAIILLRKIANHPALLSKAGDSEVSESSNLHLTEAARKLLPPHLLDPLSSSEEDSGKLAVLSCLLWQLSGSKERIVLVSHFTSTLDLLQRLCQKYSYSFTRLDGSTPPQKRQNIVDAFNSPHSQTFVFLLSSRAGGVGLNLTGASRILLYDVDWNPATDLQAMARVWRDGQKRMVYIYRLVLSGSVEERMFQRQVQKQGLSGAVVDACAQSSSKVTFSQQELRDLYSPASLGTCITHALLGCGCDQRGGLAPQTSAPSSTSTRACQLRAGNCGQEETQCTMDRLNEWQHFSSEFLVPGSLQDSCLEAAADFFSMVFRHEADATACT